MDCYRLVLYMCYFAVYYYDCSVLTCYQISSSKLLEYDNSTGIRCSVTTCMEIETLRFWLVYIVWSTVHVHEHGLRCQTVPQVSSLKLNVTQWRHPAASIGVNINAGNGILHEHTKPLLEPTLSYHQWVISQKLFWIFPKCLKWYIWKSFPHLPGVQELTW